MTVFLFNYVYKSEKSSGKSSVKSHEDDEDVELVPNILFPISSIFSKILFGCAYLSTSSPSSLPSMGKRNIVSTVTITPIMAYLIVLIAGLILSSFPPERIRRRPHQRINSIESTQAARTKSDIARSINSPKSIFHSKMESAACT